MPTTAHGKADDCGGSVLELGEALAIIRGFVERQPFKWGNLYPSMLQGGQAPLEHEMQLCNHLCMVS